jgi:hypothetical protein
MTEGLIGRRAASAVHFSKVLDFHSVHRPNFVQCSPIETMRPRQFIAELARPASPTSFLFQRHRDVIKGRLDLGVCFRVRAEITFGGGENLGGLLKLGVGISLRLTEFLARAVAGTLTSAIAVVLLRVETGLSGVAGTVAVLVSLVSLAQLVNRFRNVVDGFSAIAVVVVVGVFKQFLRGVEFHHDAFVLASAAASNRR